MQNSILDNLIEFQKLAGRFDSASIGVNNQLQWVLNKTNHWPNSICGVPARDEIQRIAEQMDNRELPPYLIAQTADVQDMSPLFRQFHLKEILRWQGMSLDLCDFRPCQKLVDGFKLKIVDNENGLLEWYGIVKPLMLSDKILSESILKGFLNDAHVVLVVGYYNDKPVTTGLAFQKDGVSGLYFIATLPEYQGKGFASILVSSLIDESFSRGTKEIILHSSVVGKKLYANLGFNAEGEISTFWKLGMY